MKNESKVANFVTRQIDYLGLKQKDVAAKAGFENPNIITMIKQGHTKVPQDKMATLAIALEVEEIPFIRMCLEEYLPAVWIVVSPLLESSLTKEELQLVRALRRYAGGPYLSALTEEQKRGFDAFMLSLRAPATIQ